MIKQVGFWVHIGRLSTKTLGFPVLSNTFGFGSDQMRWPLSTGRVDSDQTGLVDFPVLLGSILIKHIDLCHRFCSNIYFLVLSSSNLIRQVWSLLIKLVFFSSSSGFCSDRHTSFEVIECSILTQHVNLPEVLLNSSLFFQTKS